MCNMMKYRHVYMMMCLLVFQIHCGSNTDDSQNTNQPMSSHQSQVMGGSQLPDDIRELMDNGDYDVAVEELKGRLQKDPDDTRTKMLLGEVYVEYADYYMWNDDMPPRQKYPMALRYYSRALEYNPHHKKAMEGKNIILKIYDQMGRTPPEV